MKFMSLVAAAVIAGTLAFAVPQDAEAGGYYKRHGHYYEQPYYGTYPYYAGRQPHYGYSGGTGTYAYPRYYAPPPYYGDVIIVKPKKYYKRLRKARRRYYYNRYYD